jgi:hypothetical protein
MSKLSKRVGPLFNFVFAVFLIIALSGCATGKSAQQEESEKAQAPAVTPLNRGYSDIFVFEIETTPALKKDYEEAIKECQSVLITSLLMKNKYKRVEPGKSGEKQTGKTALLAKMKVSDMRIASSSARIWGGALAGSSYMNIRMTLVDAATQDVVREEDFNSTNNAWAAAWNMGASDRSLPSDMGKIMAEYIEKVVPAI